MIVRWFAILCATLLATSLPTGVSGGKIYRWVDEKGDVHFSYRKPDATGNLTGSVEKIRVKKILSVSDGNTSRNEPSSLNHIRYSKNSTFTLKGSKNLP